MLWGMALVRREIARNTSVLVILSRSNLGHIMVLTEGVEIRIEGIDLVFV